MRPLIVIAGPTAAGKSEAAFELADYLDSEIISADSLQVYKYLDIGTAKPLPEKREQVTHHLIDILEPDEDYTAFEFKTRALDHIHALHNRDRVPIIAGGTGLYIKTLTENFGCAVQVSLETSMGIKNRIMEEGLEEMYEELCRVDPEAAQRIHPNDKQRIERSLSIYRETGKSISEFYASEPPQESKFDVHFFLLQWDRDKLYDKINRRVDAMMKRGLIEETREILEKGYSRDLKPMQSIGYAQAIEYIEGKITLDQAVHEIKRETRNYAKRQLTWFRKVPDTVAIPADSQSPPNLLKEKILSRLPKSIVALLALTLLPFNPSPAWAEKDLTFERGVQAFQNKEDGKAGQLLLSIRRSSPESFSAKRALYLLGKIYAGKNLREIAVRYYIQALSKYSQIEDYIRLDLAQVYYDSGNMNLALKQVETLIANFPQSILSAQAELLKADIFKHLGQPGKAAQALEKTLRRIKVNPNGREAKKYLPEITFKLAEAYETMNAPEKALELYRELFIRHPAHPTAGIAERKIRHWAASYPLKPSALTVKEHSIRIENLLNEVRYQQAIDEIEQLRKNKDLSRLPENFYFYLAQGYQGLRNRRQANETLKGFMKNFPQRRRVQEARFIYARNSWNLGKPLESVKYFQSVVSGPKNSNWSSMARYLLGRVYEDIDNSPQAIEEYRILMEQAGEDPHAQKAAWSLAWIYYKKGDYEKASMQFEKNARMYPEGLYVEKNLFWKAKAEEKKGRADLALKIYQDLFDRFPFTYYGLRANEKLEGPDFTAPILEGGEKEEEGIPFTPLNISVTVPNESTPSLLAEKRFHFLRAQEMTRLGFLENARLEISRVEQTVRKNFSGVIWLSRMYNQAQAHSEAFRVLARYKNFKTKKNEKDLPLEFWKNYFPLVYLESIESYSKKYRVDPFLIESIIRQESMFDAQAVSRAGARGLMQLMPATGQKVFREINGDKEFQNDSLFDPDTNIHLGVKYLSGLNRQCGENGTHILICYNAGPHVLKKWLKRFNHLKDQDAFIESIPYRETRAYVKHVLRNYGIYKTLYSGRI